MSPSTPAARRARSEVSRRSARPGLRIAAGGLALAGGALLASAVPAFAESAESAESADARPSSDPAAIDGEAPTPAPTAPQYGAEPETVLLGVPIEGLLTSVQRSTNILPGSGPGDYA